MKDKFIQAARPLAEYLATLRLSNPLHKDILADLYDMVNEIRDEQITKAKAAIDALISSPSFYSDVSMRAQVARYEQIIRLQQGIE